jgi:gentisate 1,2-dioxygenase
MDNYITAYEYESNVNPSLNNVPIVKLNIKDCKYGINFLNLSHNYNVKHKSTSPNLLASFIKIRTNEVFDSNKNDLNINATSHLFYVMKGSCIFKITDKKFVECFEISEGDIFICPCFDSIYITNIKEEAHMYYINDSPLLNYLGCSPTTETFKASIYKKDFILSKLEELSNPDSNRKGILLSNKDTEKTGINTITPILWSLYNELPPKTIQKPHRHNSVALDLCISCTDTENIYTLIGENIDEEGNIINPTKVNWNSGEMFLTPPGLWHSHNNLGDTTAYVLPIQDAGLLLFQRILGIEML